MKVDFDDSPIPIGTRAVAEASPASAAACPPGAQGRIGYLAKMFPRISETFILNEVLALRRHGVPLRVYSLLPPTRDGRVHREALSLMDEVGVVPEFAWHNVGGFARALAGCFGRRPRATVRVILRRLLKPTALTPKRLFRAVLLADQIHRDRVTHLHAAWAHTPASVARIAAKLNGIPWSMAAHAKDIYLSRRSSIRKKLLSARYTLTCVRANVELLQEFGRRENGLPQPRVELFHHGVNTAYFDSGEGLPRGRKKGLLVLSVGRLVAKKGFDVLLDAAVILCKRGLDMRVDIVGDGPLRAEIEDSIRARNLEGVVRLRGLLIREEVREAYRDADCVVLASRIAADGDRDGIPNTLAEAMASNVAVVTTKLPGIAELVVDGENGVLVEPEHPEALADALERVLQDEKLRKRLGRCGRERVLASFSYRVWGRRVAERMRRSLGVERVLYISQDRGVPVQGAKGASVHLRSVVKSLLGDFAVESLILTTARGPKDGPKPVGQIVQIRTEGRLAAAADRIAALFPDRKVVRRELLRLFDNLFIRRSGVQIGRAWHPDLVYERYSLMAFAGRLIAKRLGIPYVLEVNAPLAEEEEVFRKLKFRWLTRWAESRILRSADRVVVVSEPLAKYARAVGVAEEKILLLPNGVDGELFHPGRDGWAVRDRLGLGDDLVIGFAGQLKLRYGLQDLIRAFASLQRHTGSARLLLVGEGKDRESLVKLAERLNVADRVHLVGAVPHEEVGLYLVACDILTAPYRPVDDFYFSSMKLAEYLAVGRPVVLCAHGCAVRDLDESKGVMVLPPGDLSALRRTLRGLARDGDRRERMGKAARQQTIRTWRQVVGPILEEAEACRRHRWGWPEADASSLIARANA